MHAFIVSVPYRHDGTSYNAHIAPLPCTFFGKEVLISMSSGNRVHHFGNRVQMWEEGTRLICTLFLEQGTQLHKNPNIYPVPETVYPVP